MFLFRLLGVSNKNTGTQDQAVPDLVPNTQVFDISTPGSADYGQDLINVSQSTGFPVDLLNKMVHQDGLTSIRTSATAIPRDSLDTIDENGNIKVLGAYKTPPVGSKSNGKKPCAGKIPFDRRFIDRLDALDAKDHNSSSQFPDRPYQESPDELLRLTNATDWKITELRLYNGLVYLKLEVPAYDPETKQLCDGIDGRTYATVEKHYCQEAESFRSIFIELNSNEGVYRCPKIVTDGDRTALQFMDNIKEPNTYRVYLDSIILPAKLSNDPQAIDAVSKFKGPKKLKIKSFADLEEYVNTNKLQTSHVPLLANNGRDLSRVSMFSTRPLVFIPVMVQAGDNGEAIIRDADFEHFYKHSLVPPIAYKSFNGAKKSSKDDHRYGLELLEIRLLATSKEDFKQRLNDLIQRYKMNGKLQITLDPQTTQCLKEQRVLSHSSNTIKLEGDLDFQQKLFLAKYNDLTTLQEDMPFIIYPQLDFATYLKAVQEAKQSYKENENALLNVGQASIHDLVFLHQLSHDMAMHGDEAGHPKAKPEKFSKITTYCGNKFYITHNEDQYLTLLFSNPDILKNQIIGVHPYWLRQTDADGGRSLQSAAWLDLLTIQALQQSMLYLSVAGGDPLKGFDIFISATLLNMQPKFGDAKAQAELTANIKTAHSHFEKIRLQLLQNPESGPIKEKMSTLIDDIYSLSQYNEPQNVRRHYG